MPITMDGHIGYSMPDVIRPPIEDKTEEYWAQKTADKIHETYHIVWVPEDEEFYWWDETKWRKDRLDLVEQTIAAHISTYTTKTGESRAATRRAINEVLDQIKIYYTKPFAEFNDKKLIWCKNCVYSPETGCRTEITWDKYLTHQLNFKLLEKKDLDLSWIEKLKEVTDDYEIILNHFAAIVQNIQLPYMLVLVGHASSGKSPWIKVNINLLGDNNYGSDQIATLGANGGMATCYDKNVNINTEMNISWIKNDTVTSIKQIFSDDGKINIKLLHKNSFQIEGKLNIIAATNQCGKLVEGIDEEGFFKRVRVVVCNKKTFQDDPKFLEWIASEDILNQIGSYLAYYKVKNLRKEVPLKEWIKTNTEKWNNSAYPILTFLKENFQRSYEVDAEVSAEDVMNLVQEAMEKRGVRVMSNLPAEVTHSINLMGGTVVQRKYSKFYLGIKPRFEKTTMDLTEKDKVEKKAAKPDILSDAELAEMLGEGLK